MSTVLSRAIITASISLLLNTLVYIYMGRSIRSTLVTYISFYAVIFAIPVVLGYVTTYLSKVYVSRVAGCTMYDLDLISPLSNTNHLHKMLVANSSLKNQLQNRGHRPTVQHYCKINNTMNQS